MFELRDKIRELDFATDMKFDLLGLYEMSELTDAEKKLMATIIHTAENEEKAAEEVFEILNAPNAVNMDEDCDSTLTEDVKEEIQDGDEIVYNGEHLFVTNADYMDLGKWLWVTDNEEDRYNKKASGWSLAKELVDEVIGQPDDDDDEELDESLKDFMFTVKCNDGPKELIKVVAEDKAKAEEYAKKMYAQNHTTYADDRHNIWSIEAKNESMNLKEGWETFHFSDYDDEDVVIVALTDKRFSPIDNKKQRESLRKNNVKILAHYLNGVVVEGKVGDIKNVCEDCHIMNPSKILKESLSHTNVESLKEFYNEYGLKESEEDGLENATQEYTSANTSINSAKLPAIFSMVNFKPETINLDYGGGKFDNATTALEGKGVTNLVYDPYNRSSGHNKDVIDTVRKNGGADTVTCSNVLNVIKEPEARKAVIKNIYSLLKNSGTAYFTVYEGTGKGNEGPTKSGYQLNKKTGDYVEEISSVFPSVSRRGKLIIASKGTSVTEEFDDDWSDTLETGGEPTYCPDCGVKFVRDEEGDAICPKCNKTPYQLANERRKNESLNEDDRYNIWSIDEDLSSDIDKVKHAVDQFKGQVTVSKDSGNDVREYLLSKNISFMIDDSKSAKGKLTFMLKYPKNESLNGYPGFQAKTAKANSNFTVNEALYGMNEIKQFVKMASQLGLKTMGDFKDFMDREGQGKDVITALYDYLHDEIGDLNFQAKDESLKEDKVTGKPEDADEKIQFGDEIVYNGKHLFVINANFMDSDRYLWVTDKREDRYNRWAPGKVLAKDQVDKVIRQPDEDGQGDKVNKSIDFTNAADVRHRLDRYSGRTLTVTFKGSYAWEHVSELLDEYSNGDEEEADLALDKLEAIYGSEYKLLKALEVDEISEITAMGKDVIVTIKVDKDDLYHDYSDLINNPSVNKGTVKILELDESKNESLKESDDSQFDKAVEAMKAYWNYQMSLEQLHNTLLKIYNNDAEKAFKVFAEYGDAARRSKDELLKEDNDAEEWEEVASKAVEDSDGFMTDYVWYTNGDKHVFIFGDSDIYRPEDGYFDWEIDIVEGKEAEAYKEAQDWFNSYNGFAEELDEAQDIYDIQGQAVRDARRKEVLDEFKEIFTDEPGGINLDNEETLAIVRGYLEDMGYIVEVSETQNASHPIHIEWFK